MVKIVQFGLAYSPNLGDGVISDCLVHGIRERLPEAQIDTIDLSGRNARGEVVVRNRSAMLRILEALPQPVRHRLVEFRLGRILAKVAPDWRARTDGAAMAFIGGGQIFSDADLNFCLKIAKACEILKAAKVPAAIQAVGVAENWSRRGAELFSTVLDTDLRWIGLRDAPSADAFRKQIQAPGGARSMPDLQIVRDPGLLAEGTYGRAAAGDSIGLCVTAPLILAYHADQPAGDGTGLDLFVELAQRICAAGHRVSLFCNGAEEDWAALTALAEASKLRALFAEGKLVCAPRPTSPTELAHLVSSYRAVLAHRLHACILAFAYRLPVVGIGWDRKVQSFFESVYRPDLFVAASETDAETIVARFFEAIETGIDAAAHRDIISETQAGIDRALEAGLGRPVV